MLNDTLSDHLRSRTLHVRLTSNDTYTFTDANVLAPLCQGDRRVVTLEGAAALGDSHVHLASALGALQVSCSVQLIRLRLSATARAVTISEGGTLQLSGQSRIEGTIENRGMLRYAMPAPIGMHVPGGRERACDAQTWCDADASAGAIVIEFDASATEPTIHDMPQPCAAGYLGSSAAHGEQRSFSCSGACPRGAYCPEGSANATLCAPGTYNPAVGAQSSESCVPCQRGARCPKGAAAPIDCDEGSFQDTPGQSTCQTCPDGTYCPRKGMVTPQTAPCARGSYHDPLTNCTVCPIGSMCDGVARHLCPAGSHTWHEGEHQCTRCPAGSYMS